MLVVDWGDAHACCDVAFLTVDTIQDEDVGRRCSQVLPFDVSSLVVWCFAGTSGGARSAHENSHFGRKSHYVPHCTVGDVMLFLPKCTFCVVHFSDTDVELCDHQKVNAHNHKELKPQKLSQQL